jgi:hypothetical protein
MAERSGFFNALYTNGEYDRKYNANDYSDNLAVIISNGVLRSENDDLRVTASGMACTVAAGRAWINGKYYFNDAPVTFAAATAPAGGSRWDRIMLRLDSSVGVRSIKLRYAQGTAANSPVKPAPVRSGNIYELVLADVFVGTNATSVTVTDTRSDASVCGWVYSVAGDNSFLESLDNSFTEWFGQTRDTLSSVTLFKRYTWRTVLETAAQYVNFNIPQYDVETCFLEVYVNGVLVLENVDFSHNDEGRLGFPYALVAGTEIVVNAYKSIDGTGIMSVADEITQLQIDVAALNSNADYEYHCNGIDDNVQLSAIAKAWLEGGDDYSSKTIRVYGTFGAQAPVGGDGELWSPYRWIEVAGDNYANRKIIFDFSCCSQLEIPVVAGKLNYIFYGIDAHIIGADVNVYEKGTGTTIIGFSTVAGAVYAENCRFWITGDNTCKVSCTGTFTNCRASVANSTGESYCFTPLTNSLLRLNGGEYMAYSGSSATTSAVVGHSASVTNAVSILNGVNAPTWERGGYYQTHSVHQYAGGGVINCHDLVSALPINAKGTNNISGTITKSKARAG